MDIFKSFTDTFWSRHVWLPPNETWANVAKNDVVQHTVPSDLMYPLPIALVIIVLRIIFERYWFSPLGLALGIKSSKPKKAPPNPVLEKAFKKLKGPNRHKEIIGLSKQVDMSERQIERWLRLRKKQDRPSTLVKFCETCWRCLYYTLSFTGGLYVLWDKEWLWDIKHCWYNYPHHNLTNDIWWYYVLSMSFYWSLTFSQFFDVKRKDFWQMFVHHICTLVLMGLSWVCNLCRVGSLVLVTHDSADILLEAAKSTKYANYQRTCDVCFVLFTVLWLLSRIGIYPFWIIHSAAVTAPTIIEMFPAYYIFNSLLLLLLALHIAWTYLIMKIAYNSIVAGQMDGDVRSSSSDEIPSVPSDEDASSNHVNQNKVNQHNDQVHSHAE